jgi:SAM-dependent methyltransferase
MNTAELYRRVREKEGRIYPDQIAAHLPAVPQGHPQRVEWLARADSAHRLLRYIRRLPSPLHVLELGCGNGWLSHKIGALPGVCLWGLDRGGFELTQAARIFDSLTTGFLIGDIYQPPFSNNSFDLIILASVIQYFPDLPDLIHKLRRLLTQGGEIHVLDSPLYVRGELAAARERTRAYYAALGLPEMADHYFHHAVSELADFSVQLLYYPSGWQARFLRLFRKYASPFPWFSIR